MDDQPSDRATRIDELEKPIKQEPHSESFQELAELYLSEGKAREAERVCVRGMGFHPNLPAGHFSYGKALIQLGRIQDGMQALERVCTLRNNAPEVLIDVAAYLISARQKEAAQPYLEKARELAPDNQQIVGLEAELRALPAPVDFDRLKTEPITLQQSEGEGAEAAEHADWKIDSDEMIEPVSGDKLPAPEPWPAWTSQPPPAQDAFAPVPKIDQEQDTDSDEWEPPTVYTTIPGTVRTTTNPRAEPLKPPRPAPAPRPAQPQRPQTKEETMLDSSPGLRAQIDDAVDRAVKQPVAPPTIVARDPTTASAALWAPKRVEEVVPWAAEKTPLPSGEHHPAARPAEPPTRLATDSQESAPAARPLQKTPDKRIPPTQYTPIPAGANAAHKEAVEIPTESIGFMKVLLVLVPFLIVGLALGGYFAYRHIRGEKIESLAIQVRSLILMDTFSGYSDARALLDQLLDMDGENLEGRGLLAQVKARLADEYGPNLELHDQARNLLGALPPEALRFAPALWTRFQLGSASSSLGSQQGSVSSPLGSQQGDDPELSADVAAVLEKEPEDPQLLALAGEIAARLGDRARAAEFFGKALQTPAGTTVRTLYRLAEIEIARGDTSQAIEHLQRGLAINGIHTGSLLLLSQARIDRGVELPLARQDLEKVIEQPKVAAREKAEAHFLLSRLAFRQFERNQAVAQLKAALDGVGNDRAFTARAARLLLDYNELDEAAERAGQVLKDDPEDMGMKLLVIGTDLPRGNPEKVLLALTALEGKRVPAAPFFLLRGQALLQVGKAAEASADLQKVPDGAPEKQQALAFAVLAAIGAGDGARAGQLAAAFLRVHPESGWGHWVQGRVYLSRNAPRLAAGEFQKAVDADPLTYPAYTDLARIARDQGRLDEALELVDAALKSNPYARDAMELRGTLKLARKDAEGALEAFARVVQEHPNSREGFLGMAEALLRLNRIDHAYKAVQKAQQAAGAEADARTYHLEGRIDTARGRFSNAVAALSRADRLQEKDPEILADLGLAQLGARSLTGAEKNFKESLKRGRVLRAQEGLAKTLLARGKYSDAAYAFERAAAWAKKQGWTDAECAAILMQGGDAWIRERRQRDHFGQARRLFRQAAGLLPSDPEPLFQLAAAYDRDDKLAAARAAYQKVLELDASHGNTLYRLGLLEFDEGNDPKAKDYLERYLKTDPKGKDREQAERLLKKIK